MASATLHVQLKTVHLLLDNHEITMEKLLACDAGALEQLITSSSVVELSSLIFVLNLYQLKLLLNVKLEGKEGIEIYIFKFFKWFDELHCHFIAVFLNFCA